MGLNSNLVASKEREFTYSRLEKFGFIIVSKSETQNENLNINRFGFKFGLDSFLWIPPSLVCKSKKVYNSYLNPNLYHINNDSSFIF